MDKVAARTARGGRGRHRGAPGGRHLADADIVRLAEINAFLAYQIRVVAGLRLLKGGEA